MAPQAKKEQKVYALRELPLPVRQRLEGFLLEGHVYSADPQRRFVFIDARTYRAGERIGEGGPVLVEITPDGAVVDYGDGLALLPVYRY